MSVDPYKTKDTISQGDYQPSLFEDQVVETRRPQSNAVTRPKSRRTRYAGTRKASSKIVELKAYKGKQIATHSQIRQVDGCYLVPSESGNYKYRVDSETYNCECPDFQRHGQRCKHIIAVEIAFNIQHRTDLEHRGTKCARDWRAYNKSQTSEKSVFLRLLSELTRSIVEPAKINGRPPINLGDMVFACVYKVYSQMSSRRFSVDLEDAEAKGYIDEIPHFSSLNRYMEKEGVSQCLHALVEETARPFTALETDFAIDSTGLSISNTVAWSHAQCQDKRLLQTKNWVKVHCCIGTHTNIITSVMITDKSSHDSKHFRPLLDKTIPNFEVREVSADAAYSNNDNLNYAVLNNIGAFIPFRKTTSFNNKRSSSVWHRLYHFFQFNRSEFLKSYGKRNNAESTFHMLKSKFGSTLKSRNWEAQKNEALCKVVCHNIVCLVHAMNAFGIDPESLEITLLSDAKPLKFDENVLKA